MARRFGLIQMDHDEHSPNPTVITWNAITSHLIAYTACLRNISFKGLTILQKIFQLVDEVFCQLILIMPLCNGYIHFFNLNSLSKDNVKIRIHFFIFQSLIKKNFFYESNKMCGFTFNHISIHQTITIILTLKYNNTIFHNTFTTQIRI